ncbi:MAG: hypothetical protein Fur0041_02400 [Bacteroidia bacterium]
MNSRVILGIVFAMTGVMFLIGAWYYFGDNKPSLRSLPYYNPIHEGVRSQTAPGDNHKVKDFKLLDQTGDTVTRKDFANTINVVDFFFTTCRGICPKMTSQMGRVYEKYKGNKEIKFLSHTVNPENDSVAVMAAFAKEHNIDNSQWYLLTGDKPQLYDLARTSYLISDTKGDGGKEDFVHSQNFTLVDKNGFIRGIYNGIDSADVDRLMIEIDILLKEKK